MNSMNILVTGGAGYIGSACVKELVNLGFNVFVVDNLSKGKRELIDCSAKFYEIDLTKRADLEKVFLENKIDAVIHFAAYKAVEESMENAVKYSDNIIGAINLLNCMVKFNTKRIIFSSTAAVYGMPKTEKVDENTETKPINFYGFTKLEIEKILEWYNKIHKIEYIALRYFNVAGDANLNYVDPNAKNIFPIIMEVLTGKREKLLVFGDDYETKDGTCIRDYIDINDLVDAHILALNSKYCGIINLGSGNGYSVKELIRIFEEVSGKTIPFEIAGRRAGDSACLIASNFKAKEILCWFPKRTLKQMVESTYLAYKNNNLLKE